MSRYVFKLEKNFEYTCKNIKSVVDLEFKDKKGNLWLTITKSGQLKIKKDYSWDGCSIKINIFDLFWIGTPDGLIDTKTGKPITYYASMVHDSLYQFKHNLNNPFTRKEIDIIFLDILKEAKFKLRYIYYAIVRLVGWIFWLKK